MKIALWMFCLVIATPALAGSFDVPVTSLEAKLNSWIDAPRDGAPQGLRPEAHATPQECSRKSELSCSVVIFNVMIIASGTELPAKTTSLMMLLFYAPTGTDQDGKNIWSAIIAAVAAYDPSFFRSPDNAIPKLKDLIEGARTMKPRSFDGVEAHYRLEITKIPWDTTIDTAILHITPR